MMSVHLRTESGACLRKENLTVMYSVQYHYCKDLDSDVVVTSRRPTLFAYYSELFLTRVGC